jgi:hypothetical protein
MQNVQNRLDTLISRVLFVPSKATTAPSQEPRDAADIERDTRRAEGAFSFALVFSGVRCILMYVVMPFILPIIGIAGTGAAYLDLGITVVAMGAILYSLRRFWSVDYKYKWQYLPVAVIALVILGTFMLLDIQALIA